MLKPLPIGPLARATVVCNDLDGAVAAYQKLGMRCRERGALDPQFADACGAPAARGATCAILCDPGGTAWLRLVEDRAQEPAQPFARRGWMALEVVVENVDRLAEDLRGGAFEVLREPANLDIGDAARAMQVAGPGGETLYLTQISDELPPFDLPRATTPVGSLFVAVANAADLDQSLAFYGALAATPDLDADPRGHYLRVETKLSSFNQAHGLPLEERHEIAFVQLPGKTAIEIDLARAPTVEECATPAQRLPAGIAVIEFIAREIDPDGHWARAGKIGAGDGFAVYRAPSGELVALVSPTAPLAR